MTAAPDLPTCSVLRCHNVGAAVVNGEVPHDFVETFVCAEHKATIDAGAVWDWNDGRVLMGTDLPGTLTRWSLRDSSGTEGFTLTLETATQPEDKPFSVFLTPADADQLLMLLRSRGTDQQDS